MISRRKLIPKESPVEMEFFSKSTSSAPKWPGLDITKNALLTFGLETASGRTSHGPGLEEPDAS